ncbi:MAG: type I-C CRISPR-associated endonuclease Cas1c [Clostridiales Family XIII bacterium]|jgi:CRISPR-associated protein Cas1|nr:type I-C CRISPR-associated endonuclease Cas1c [Clostridiales Family XIII bacterium]
MRKLLNTIYVTTPESYLTRDGENLVVKIDKETKFRMPFSNIEGIVCFGYMGASPSLMGKCADENISLSFMTPSGRYLASVHGKTHGSVFLRKKQYQVADDLEFCLDFSKNIIAAKLYNSHFLLNRSIRDNREKCDVEKLEIISSQIGDAANNVFEMHNKDELRGFEGAQAKAYFSVFDDMLLQQKGDFIFTDRSKRPPLDYINCMLSYLYTILSFEIASALETVGLDPQVGFMHELRSGRSSLALDIEEELRTYLVDRLVISMINLKQISKKDFFKKEGGAIMFTDDGKKKILNAWQERKREIVKHPYIEEKIEIGLIPYVQAQLLARHLRGDIDEYPAFTCK